MAKVGGTLSLSSRFPTDEYCYVAVFNRDSTKLQVLARLVPRLFATCSLSIILIHVAFLAKLLARNRETTSTSSSWQVGRIAVKRGETGKVDTPLRHPSQWKKGESEGPRGFSQSWELRPVRRDMEVEKKQGSNSDFAKRAAKGVNIGPYVLKLDLEDADEFLKEVARQELRETPEVVEQAIKDLRKMIKDESNLIMPDDNETCQKFLRPCKWYPKSAFELIKRCYKYKQNNFHLFEKLVPSNVKKVFSAGLMLLFPERTANGCRIMMINCGKPWNPKQISLDEILQSAILTLQSAMFEPKTQIGGIHIILNMDGLSLRHVTQFSPNLAAKIMEWIQRCTPCRLKGVHVVNQPFIFNMVFAFFRPFLLEKVRNRLYFHGTNRESLIAITGAKAIPVELGGNLELPTETIGPATGEYFCNFEEDFEEECKWGYKSTK